MVFVLEGELDGSVGRRIGIEEHTMRSSKEIEIG